MRKLIITVSCIIFSVALSAQRFGGTPPPVKWKQINTDTARIIFPEGLDSQAQRVASVAHYQAGLRSGTLGDQLRKINIVLQNQTVIPNGYVGLGPWRSEFYLTPASNNFEQGSIPWTDQLAIHEYRHVEQFNNFNNGISRLMKILFGEEGYALATNASVPDWFFEGDAVYNETVLSNQGRGRLPLFMNAYPSLWQAGKNYSWMKLRNGSWKDYVPSHYNLGYLLVNYGNEKYGADFWGKVTRDASAFKGLFYPFQRAIKKHTGRDYKTFRNEALDYYKELSQKENQPKTSAYGVSAVMPVNRKYVTNYVFPYQLSPDSLLYLRTSYRHRPAFFIKDKRGRHRLRVRDIGIDDQFSYRNGIIVYTAYETDPRWRWRDYSVIKVYDIRNKRHRTLTRRSKYFTPDISASGNKIAAIHVPISGKCELHILDATSGSLEKKLSNSDINLFTDPKFIHEDSLVAAARFGNGQMALVLVDLVNNNITPLTPSSFNVVGYPYIGKGIIYFSASYQGRDNIYAVKLDDKKIFKLSDGITGDYFVNALSQGQVDRLVWSAFTAEGYQLQQKEIPQFPGQPLREALTDTLNELYPVSHSTALAPFLNSDIPERKFETNRYKKATRLLNFHSWRPYYEDPEFSFSLYGQNVLNTLETELYYLYNQNDNTNAVGFSTVYGAWFPYISAGTQYTFDRTQLVNDKTRVWDQLDTRIGLSIPLSFTSGRTYKNLNVGTDYVYRNDRIKGEAKADFENNNFSYLAHRLSFSQQVESAVQHIYPRLAYSLSGQYRHAITNVKSWQFLGGAALYLPGIASTHNLVFTGAFQETDTLNALFGNRFSYSRGYNELYAARMWRSSANYHFPIVYPDWGFASILYLQRIRANGFFDFSRLYSKDKSISVDQRSVGGELYVDTKWWNQYELSFGIRVSRLLDNDLVTGSKETVFEFILPVSIFPR